MTTTLLLALLVAGPGGVEDDIVRGIVESGHKKVGVIPTVISRRGDHEATIGSLGPRGKVMANAIYSHLITASQTGRYKGKFSVVPERVMRAALKARTLDDLSKPRKVQELAKDVGNADGFIIAGMDEDLSKVDVTTVSSSGETDADGTDNRSDKKDKEDKEAKKAVDNKLTVETVDAKDGTVTDKVDGTDELTLSKAAYQGQSWELRRWNADKLESVGIGLEGKEAFGRGSAWERAQYVSLKSDLDHPHSDSTFPYPISIKVGESIRDPIEVEGKMVVELNQGEVYSVQLQNDGEKDVYVALYVDGVNTVDQKMTEPDALETQNHWYLRSGKTAEIKGWQRIERDAKGNPTGKQSYEEFEIVEKADSMAAGQGFGDSIGMITAVFYTVGTDGFEEPTHKPRALPQAIVGTGKGEEIERELKFASAKRRGLMLAAWTFYYRTDEQIKEIKSGKSQDLALNSDDVFVDFKSDKQSEGADGQTEKEMEGENQGESGDNAEDKEDNAKDGSEENGDAQEKNASKDADDNDSGFEIKDS